MQRRLSPSPNHRAFSSFREIINSIQLLPEKNLKINTHGLDWIKISECLMNVKSPEECLIQWIFHDHPLINNRPWNKDELDRLSETILSIKEAPTAEPVHTHANSLMLVDANSLKDVLGKHRWQIIAEKHGNHRTEICCFIQVRIFELTANNRRWTPHEDMLLKKAVQYFGTKNWQAVSGCLEGRSGQQCLHRWLKSLDPKIHRGKWTPAEDECLRKAVRIYGVAKWSQVQQMVPGRTDVQCRERWSNILDPSLNLGKWSAEETSRLKDLVMMFGLGKWSLVASHLPNRTDNQTMEANIKERRHCYSIYHFPKRACRDERSF
ncbi:hypothetical protein DI09_37p170 [Mitosporidium daphniae]|uniref:Uncharacterized protein n=1 Tax=Mitosporidium daphniae TaxID=1485682 RepID=A0A098VR40_9MICR|nr:uncharacterized protein DI09_37p170 [Mitosporidium daphniae]KGG51380.1 hypothetical protein DI09_37p170 [Mitosporidium daphniae]|eukprot:XP_013237807.1 uncharacterized protein DI09_37p170 [Mitosporidium daphniae]